MTEKYKTSKHRKKQKLKITSISDFKEALRQEGYEESDLNELKFKEIISKIFNIDNSIVDIMYKSLKDNDTIYRADDVKHFIEYMKNIKLFEEEHKKLSKTINKISK